MEDQFIKDIEKFDNQLIKDYMIKIRNEIFNVLEDLRNKNDKNYEIIVSEEKKLFNDVKNDFYYRDEDNSEKINKLTKLIDGIEKFDNQLKKDYMIIIRKEIFNVLEDIQNKNDDNYEIIVSEEIRLFNNVKNNFYYRNEGNSKGNSEELNKLFKLIKIYSYLSNIFNNNLCSNESLNNLKSLIKD